MDGLVALNELNELTARLSTAVNMLQKYGKDYALAERNYKVALSEQALRLRAQDMPVTLIDKVIHGKVANERFNRDTAEVLYKTAQENINAIKLQIRILDAQIAREWGRNE